MDERSRGSQRRSATLSVAVASPGISAGCCPDGDRGVVPRPALFDLLSEGARVTLLSAPAGSGKTVLVCSWIASAGLADRVAWVAVGRNERDAQRFWLSVLDALRATDAG